MEALSRKCELRKKRFISAVCYLPSMTPSFHHIARTPLILLPLPQSPLLFSQAPAGSFQIIMQSNFIGLYPHLYHLSHACCNLYPLYQPHLSTCLAKQDSGSHPTPCVYFSEFELLLELRAVKKCVFLITSDTMR